MVAWHALQFDPMQNITVSVDEEGFEYPVISGEKCVKCNSCISVCPLKIK